MIVKKYVGETMQKAFDAVKRDLGPDAVILHTKTKKRNGLLGLLGKEMVEITASKDVNIMQTTPAAKPESSSRAANHLVDLYKKFDTKETQSDNRRTETAPSDNLLHYELKEIKTLVNNLIQRAQYADMANLSDELMEFYIMLVQQQVSDEFAKEVVQRINNELRNEELNNKEIIKTVLKNALSKMLRDASPITLDKPGKKVAFIGPTGVGKTTTIAKLAAHFALRQGKKVGLVTMDTYRIAAVEQLRTYADIMNVPIEVVLTSYEMKKAIEKLKDQDLILIDTAGRSQNNKMQIAELKSFIDVIQPDEVHLVLSTITAYETIMNTVERFNELRFDKLLFTKLDEAVNFGLILNVMRNVRKHVSYVTTGQNVPYDIEEADGTFVAELILGERNVLC